MAAELTVRRVERAAGRTVTDALRQWTEVNEDTWAPSTRRDHRGRIAAILADPVARVSLARLSVVDVERWHARLRRARRSVPLRAALPQAVR